MRPILLVGVGGAGGALLRWGVAEEITVHAGGFPWPTLLVNLVGCFLIGIAARRLAPATDAWFAGVTGALGGFTTYSTFANETRSLFEGGHVSIGVVYVAVTILGGLVGVEFGRGVSR